MIIIRATIEHLNDLVPLFDGYRIFDRQASDLNSVKEFLKERLTKQDSVIYMAYINDTPVGFTQLYFLFSSVSMKPMYLLNDLYIDSNYRSQNIGTTLINKAKKLCEKKEYKGLLIQTENTNPAQHLYQRLGFVEDTDLTFFG
ncbi:GNAT family N-acetyltransferase [Flavivirga rizhaonensis]|uniref:GNAT family N-acetyltransferase n=1 Tax=Flavivirga rizhaonensis TaxID=2559571 RepID=A0A4S1DUE5_9FLAO|nr:GNAT family N-acetyltransferase [Flavivirga rizhaonensis]TGV01701.1 GNAT family N-acetyltransferase [Flavivirga rizhaonensis]